MPAGSPSLRLSRRGALRMLTALAAAAIVPLGSVVHAQSNGEPASDTPAQPGSGQPGSGQPGASQPAAQPANGANPNNRFASPLAPAPSPQPVPPGGQPAPASSGSSGPGSSTSSAPAAADTPPANAAPAMTGAQAGSDRWVQNHRPTELWSGPDAKAITFGTVPAFSYFKVLGAQEGDRVRVQNPLTNGIAFVTAKDIGPSGLPPEWYLSQKSQLSIPARIVGGANIRSTPGVQDGNIVHQAGHNEGVEVLGEVLGTDKESWYRVGPNQFVHNSLVRVPSKFTPHPGKLIVAELTDPCMVTAYEDAKPVYSALSLKGTVGWHTPTGFFTILRRVANETMSSETLGIDRNAPGGYYLKDVLFTQYFTNDGSSIHYNYWSSNWGYSGSHGCLGMNYDDSLWFWEWGEVGTPMVIQE